MAGAKNLRKMKPLIAVYPTSSCISKEMGGVEFKHFITINSNIYAMINENTNITINSNILCYYQLYITACLNTK